MSVAPGELAARLAGVSVRSRDDVEFSRHVVGGEPSYVVHDPITFVSHALGRGEYESLLAIDTHETLGEAFDTLCADGVLDESRDDEFYGYVIGLHRLGLLALPVSDDAALFERFERKRKAVRRSRMLGFLSLRVPIWNPDAFLKRAMPFGKVMYSRGFAAFYALVLAASALVALRHSEAIAAATPSLMDVRVLAWLWLILIVNKVFHEFGHAFACRVMGGPVPEMGAIFIAFTPCAYVDASASWMFASRWRRMVVNLGGVYFESMLAIGALWVWLLTGPGLVHDLAFQVLVMASAVTLLFNLNPLARFDGYYVLSDLVNIPNLRKRANAELKGAFCRVALGSTPAPTPYGPLMRTALALFAIASSVYRVALVLFIATVVASKFFIFGVLIAVVFLATTVFSAATSVFKLFVLSEEASRARVRAALVGLGLVVGAPALLAMAPVPRPVEVIGVIEREVTSIVRAPSDGVVVSVAADVGDTVESDGRVLELENLEIEWASRSADAALLAAEAELATRVGDAWETDLAQRALDAAAAEARYARDSEARLTVASPVAGRVLSLSEGVRRRSSVRTGEPLATIGTGGWVAVLYVDDSGAADARPTIGQPVSVRGLNEPGRVIAGTVIGVSPAGDAVIRHKAVTQAGGGPIPVDDATGRAAQAYAEVRVLLDVPEGDRLLSGGRAVARFDARVESIGDVIARRALQFIETLRTQ